MTSPRSAMPCDGGGASSRRTVSTNGRTRRRQASVLRPSEGWRSDRLRRPVGDLDGPQRRGDGNRRHHHHAGEPRASQTFTRACLRSFLRRRSIYGSTAARRCVDGDRSSRACARGMLEAYEISPAVNRTANDDPLLIEPLRQPPAAAEKAAPAARQQIQAQAGAREGRAPALVV